MPTITIPEIVFTDAAKAWAEQMFGPHTLHQGVYTLLACVQGEIITEFELGTPEPAVEDVTDIFFHTFTCGGDGQEFVITPTDGALLVDICERKKMVPIESGPMAGKTFSIPTKKEDSR